MLGKNLASIGALCSQHFENRAIAPFRTTNEYLQYLFEPWDFLHTNFVSNDQIQLQHMFATGLKRHYLHS